MLALLAEEYPKVEWDLQVEVGWLALALLSCFGIWAWARSESFRRAVFAREDPRLFGLMRIILGVFTFQCFWNLRPYWRMLWSDEGIFDLALARQRLGRVELSGWTEVDGFLDGWAVARFLWGKHSLFYFHGSPEFVNGYMVVFFVVLVFYTVGFRSRVSGLVALMMMNGIYNRNGLYLEGTDTVFRVGWFLMIFARVDGAWSVDNWLRQRRERRLDGAPADYDWRHWLDRSGSWVFGGFFAGWFCLLTDVTPKWVAVLVLLGVSASALVGLIEQRHRQARAADGSLPEWTAARRGPSGEPIRFQLIPAWPRYLLIAQLICIYTSTGLYKTGDVWEAGDALYYALNMDHFYRFEGSTQWVSALFATSIFRWMTWITLWWEKLFGIVAVGIVLGWGLQHRDEPWYRAMDSTLWRKWLGRLALVAIHLLVWRIAVVSYPWSLELQDKVPQDPTEGLATINRWMFGYIPALVVAWFVLGRWPLRIPRLIARRRGAGPIVIDQAFMRAWLFGRRVWLFLGFFFHAFLIIGMNIGMFPFVMLWIYFAFFTASPWLAVARWKIRVLRRFRATAWMAPRWMDAAVSADVADRPGGVLESSAQTLARDPSGPWWLDPWRMLVGAIALLRERRREVLVRIDDQARERGGRLPDALVLAALAVIVSLAVLRGFEAQSPSERRVGGTTFVSDVQHFEGSDAQARKAEAEGREARIERLATGVEVWGFSLLGFAFVAHFRRRSALDRDPANQPVLLGSPLIRTTVLGFMIWHSGAVASLFTPTYPITAAWRGEVRAVFGGWINGTNTNQSWKMFAPNPPRANGFMRTVAVTQDGEEWILGGVLGDDHFENRPRVFFWNDRMRKMHRRMSTKSKWYLRYWAEFHCREWALEHGELPREIQILVVKTPIPKPDQLEEPSDPRKRKVTIKHLQTHQCVPNGDLTPTMKERRGIELDEDDRMKVDAEARRAEREADTRRRNWAARKDWGGDPEANRAKLDKAERPGVDEEDEPGPDDEGG